MNIKNGQHNHKAIVAANIVFNMHMQHSSIFKQISMHTACIMLRICWDNSPKTYSKRSVLDLACESIFCLIPSMPQCLSWLWMLSVLSSTSCDNPFLSLKSFMITELMTDNRTLRQQVRKTTKFWVWIWLDHVGGTRCCESNESLIVTWTSNHPFLIVGLEIVSTRSYTMSVQTTLMFATVFKSRYDYQLLLPWR